MSLKIREFIIKKDNSISNPRNQKSGDLDKNSKRNRSFKFRETFVSRND